VFPGRCPGLAYAAPSGRKMDVRNLISPESATASTPFVRWEREPKPGKKIAMLRLPTESHPPLMLSPSKYERSHRTSNVSLLPSFAASPHPLEDADPIGTPFPKQHCYCFHFISSAGRGSQRRKRNLNGFPPNLTSAHAEPVEV